MEPWQALLANKTMQGTLESLESACLRASAPLPRMEHALHPWVAYGIMPLFALANAGVPLFGQAGQSLAEPVSLGIFVGLFIGKLLGMYEVEAAIVTCCHSGLGGTGDVAILSASNRMGLMPFAQISTRIGGAGMVVLAVFLLKMFG